MPNILSLLRLLRPKQWVKNLFVLAPLIFSGKFLSGGAVIASLEAFLFFCIASSATYVLNDISDIEHDRLHPKKAKQRPLAAGEISVSTAVILLIVLYGCLVLSYFVMPIVSLVILAYLLINLAYTFCLKHQPVLDIFTIAIGFVLRVTAGILAIQAPMSGWMLVTTLCLALYLGAIKRRQELHLTEGKGRKVLEKYSVSLTERYADISMTGALMFYSLFVLSEKPQLLISIPFVLFGLFRYWYIVEKLDGGESPTDALFSDWPLIITIVGWASICTYVYYIL